MSYKIRQIKSNFLDTNCYLITTNNVTILIDPCVTLKQLEKYSLNKVDAIFITHVHVDHINNLDKIAKKYNSKIYTSKKGVEKIFDDSKNLSLFMGCPLQFDNDFDFYLIKDNETINFLDIQIKCIHTPGHSDCSYCYIIEEDMFTGDTLFDRSVGRTDLYSGNTLQLVNSLKKIIKINVNFSIYPGHGNISTINEQIENNGYFKYYNII